MIKNMLRRVVLPLFDSAIENLSSLFSGKGLAGMTGLHFGTKFLLTFSL
jgi:hypothetical protein